MQRICELQTIEACIFGLAVGDALGVPAEFRSRTELAADPVTDLRGYGTYAVPSGSWSDDTSMTLCALDALAQEHFTMDMVMVNFGKWYYHGEYTPTGTLFDIGGTCRTAIEAYCVLHLDTAHCGCRDAQSNGNGSLMRILPFALYAPEDIPWIEQASSLTHAHRRSQMACGIFSFVLSALLENGEKAVVYDGLRKACAYYGRESEWRHFAPLLHIETRSRDSIRSGGYVVDTLEAALWCLMTTDSYAECVLKAVNLGADADTTAAVAGALAGALYGLKSIPERWRNGLQNAALLHMLCQNAAIAWK